MNTATKPNILKTTALTTLRVAPAASDLPAKAAGPLQVARPRRGGNLPVSPALDGFPTLKVGWNFQAASCHNGGFHRLGVEDTATGKGVVLAPWVIRPSAKTGDCWVRLMDAQGGAVGRDVRFDDLASAKTYVEQELARLFHGRQAAGRELEVQNLTFRTLPAATQTSATQRLLGQSRRN